MILARKSIIVLAISAVAAACGINSTPNVERKAGNAAPPSTSNSSNAAVNAQTVATPVSAPAPTATPAKSTQTTNANATTSPERPRVVEEKKSAKAGPTPASAIPSDDEMRKAFSKPVTKDEVNDPGMRKSEPMMKSKGSEVPMMKSTRNPANKP